MYQTLFVFKAYLFDGWLLLAWIVLGVGMMLFTARKHGWGKETWGYLPVLIIGAVIIHFLLPHMLLDQIDPSDVTGQTRIPLGLPVHGWGFMVMLAAIASVGLAMYRAKKLRIDPDLVLSLAFAMFVAGIVGARLFYIIQYRDRFDSFASLFNVGQGGMVVYGSVIGGLIAAIVFLRSKNLPILQFADLIAPSMVLGLAIGRIGCLMNGCCYGGLCDWPVAVTFPEKAPPYSIHLQRGLLVGIVSKPVNELGNMREVVSVKPNSIAAAQGIEAGDRFQAIEIEPEIIQLAREYQTWNRTARIKFESGKELTFRLADLPKRSLPIHPTQIYSAINAFLICFFLWFYFPYRFADGEVFALLVVIYSITRFLLEYVRVDEGEQLGTGFTISQLISVGMFTAGVILLLIVRLGPRPSNATA